MMKKAVNQQSYNQIAKQWDEYRQKRTINPFVEVFATMIKPGGRILDVGCGSGIPIDVYLSQNGFFIDGIDFSFKMIQLAKNHKINNTHYQVQDVCDYQPTILYDGIIAYDSLFHLEKEEQTRIYPLLSQWLKPGGVLLFTHGKVEGEAQSTMFDHSFYYSALDLEILKSHLEKAGFSLHTLKENYEDEYDKRDLIILAIKK